MCQRALINMEWFELEDTLKDYQVQPLCAISRDIFH